VQEQGAVLQVLPEGEAVTMLLGLLQRPLMLLPQ
jgi:hypothetical protein